LGGYSVLTSNTGFGGDVSGTYNNLQLGTGVVGSTEVADNSLTATDLAVNVVSSLDGVTNDGGNIDLVAGSGIAITPDDANNQITIASTAGGLGGSGTATQVAFFTAGTTIGSDSNLYWDNTNKRLGIGTTGPSEKLDVAGNIRISNGQSIGTIYETIGGWYRPDYGMAIPGSSSFGSTNFLAHSWGYAPHFAFRDAYDNTAWMVITSGNVGIGTTSPVSKLHLYSGPDLFITLETSAPSLLDIFSASSPGYSAIDILNTVNGRLDFRAKPLANKGQNAGVTRTIMTLNGSSGNVGIGTTNPKSILHVAQNDGAADTARAPIIMSRYWGSDSDTRAAAIFNYYNSANLNDQLVIGVTGGGGVYTNPTLYSNAKMVVQANGNVGIGTTSPGSALHVVGQGQFAVDSVGADTVSYGTLGVTRTASANTLSYIAMTRSGNVVKAMGIDSSNRWVFGVPTAGTQIISTPQMVIDSSGNVGIGTTSPGNKLHVVGSAANVVMIDSTSTNDLIGLYRDGIRKASIGVQNAAGGNGLFIYHDPSGTFPFFVNSVGNVGIGTTDPGTSKLKVDGKAKLSSAYIPQGFSVSYTSVAGPGTGSDNVDHVVTCPAGYGIYGIAVYSTAAFDGFLTAWCINMIDFLDTATQSWTTPTGDINNGPQVATCSAGYAATGIKVHATTYLDYGLSLLCTKLKTGFSSTAIPNVIRSNYDMWTSADNVFHQAMCLPGTYVEAVGMYAVTYLEAGLQLGCSYPTW
jgi:hypothetical protein